MRAVWIAGVLLLVACSPDQPVNAADFADIDAIASADLTVGAGSDLASVADVQPELLPDVPVDPCAGPLACDSHATCAPIGGCICALGWFGSGWACQPWLSGIRLNGVPLAGFADNVFAYAEHYGISVATVTVTVDAPADVSLTVNGQPLESGVASAPVVLHLGKNVLTVVATGPGAQATYTITVTRGLAGQEAYVKASNTNAGDYFGSAIAISGDTLVVGAKLEGSNATGINGNQADNSAKWSGAVYVFVRSGTTWSQQAYIKASNTSSDDFFGGSVAISGDTIVVGASDESSSATGINGDQTNENAPSSGAAYVFVRSGTTWSQQAYLKASNTDAWDQFGASVAISGDTIVVGATTESSKASGVDGDQTDNSHTSGAAYVFTRTGSSWTQQAYLKPSNPDALSAFGASVALSDRTIVVGAPGESTDATGVNGKPSTTTKPGSGAAYLFVQDGATWSQAAYLKAPSPHADDRFGWSVALSGDTAVVASYNGTQWNGAVYVFVRSGQTWNQQANLKVANTASDDGFGYSVAIAGDVIAIGVPWEDSNATGIDGNQANNSAVDAGAAYVFLRSQTSWSQAAYLKASNPGANDNFGRSVAADGDSVVVGATYWDPSASQGESSNATGINGNQADNSMPGAGAVYVFR